MIFTPSPLHGACIVDIEPTSDERGFFARSFAADEFLARQLEPDLRYCSVSFNALKATLRGMHYQAEPHAECKLVRCTAGAIFDVIIDLRPLSATFRRWFGCELSADNHRALYVPQGFAHGFVSLAERTEVLYMISAAYSPAHSRGVRWNDPAFAIEWPIQPRIIAQRDATYASFDAAADP